MKRWIVAILALVLSLSLAACVQEKECEKCPKLEKKIEELEDEIKDLEKELDDEPAGDLTWPPGTEPEITGCALRAVSDETVSLAIQGASFGQEVTFPHVYLSPYPAKLNVCGDGTLSRESLLLIPFYGADGRVQELSPNTVTGILDPETNIYHASGGVGSRVVGTAVDGVITEVYANVWDLSFLTKDGDQALTWKNGTMIFSADWQDDEHTLEMLATSLWFVAFDSDTHEILGYIQPKLLEAESSADGAMLQADLEYTSAQGDEGFVAELTQQRPRNISVMLYLDGESVTNADVAHWFFDQYEISINLEFGADAE